MGLRAPYKQNKISEALNVLILDKYLITCILFAIVFHP
jgi:hypothetical protein